MPALRARRWLRLLPAVAVALLAPLPALAADPPDVTTGDGGAATLLVILLLGSLTAGLFFASPLRRRLTRGSFASTGMPARVAESPLAAQLERLSGAVHTRLARATRRWPTMRTATPLPPMLGGDIFFDDDPEARPPAPMPPRAPAADAQPRSTAAPWSTGPVAADERYLPLR